MAILLNTGIRGFITSAAKTVSGFASTFVSGVSGWIIRNSGDSEFKSTVTREYISSPTYIPGFDGEGFKVFKKGNDWMMEVDKLSVRKNMTVYELLIEKIRSVGGALIVSAGNGKIKTVELKDGKYTLELEDTIQFVVNDLVRCQTWTGKDIKYYWVKVGSISGNAIVVDEPEFEGVIPVAGDELVLMGNTTNVDRQGAVYISASEDGLPRVDILSGIHDKTLAGCLVERFGCLDGIQDPTFGALKGYGHYGQNEYLKGTFVLRNGQTIVEYTDGKITTEISNAKKELSPQIQAAKDAAGVAQTSADNALKAADNAQESANAANGMITNLTDDNIISPLEKQQLKKEWDAIEGEKPLNVQQAIAFGVDSSAYVSAYSLLKAYIDTNLNDLNSEWVLGANGGSTLRSKFKAYYDSRTSLLNAIAKSAKDSASDAQNTANTALNKAIENVGFISAINKDLENMQSQLDGAIETWFYDPVPTLSNVPASSWPTDELKNIHLGDLYYSGAGKAYRFQLYENVYSWKLITDTDVTKALADAKKAQDTADGKRRVFVTAPTDTSAYDIGDLWVNATIGTYINDLLRCKTSKQTGAVFSISHWERATKYTDDSLANAARDAANEALANIDIITSDNIFSSVEKKKLKPEWDSIITEKAGIDTNADNYSITVEKVNYQNAYAALFNYVNPLMVKLDTNSPADGAFFGGTTFRARFTDFYNKRQLLLSAISAAAKTVAENFTKIYTYSKVETDQKFIQQMTAVTDTLKSYSTIEQTADSINLAVGSIQIGGRNLILNTKSSPAENYWRYNGWSVNPIVYDDSEKALIFFAYNGWQTSSCYIPVTPKGIVSFEVKNKANMDGMAIQISASEGYGGNLVMVSNEWTKISMKLDFSSGIFGIMLRGADSSNINYQVYIRNLKLESGDKATDWTSAPEDVAADVQDAKDTAEIAAESANAANMKLTDWASDSFISPMEKTALKQQQNEIINEYVQVIADASRYSITDAESSYALGNYKTGYNNALNALTKYTAVNPENIVVASDYNYISAYYQKRQPILNLIALKAKNYAEKVAGDAEANSRAFTASQIKQTKDEIDLSIRNIEIGGRNFVKNSNNHIAVGRGGVTTYPLISESLVSGETYIVTADITTSTGNISFFLSNSDDIADNSQIINLNEPFILREGFSFFAIGAYGINSYIALGNVKLERGNIPTDWTAAPEDLSENIVSQINLSTEGVKISGDKITLEGTVTANGNFMIKTDGSVVIDDDNVVITKEVLPSIQAAAAKNNASSVPVISKTSTPVTYSLIDNYYFGGQRGGSEAIIPAGSKTKANSTFYFYLDISNGLNIEAGYTYRFCIAYDSDPNYSLVIKFYNSSGSMLLNVPIRRISNTANMYDKAVCSTIEEYEFDATYTGRITIKATKTIQGGGKSIDYGFAEDTVVSRLVLYGYSGSSDGVKYTGNGSFPRMANKTLTVIGSNGIMSVRNEKFYFKMSADEGFIIQQGMKRWEFKEDSVKITQ